MNNEDNTQVKLYVKVMNSTGCCIQAILASTRIKLKGPNCCNVIRLVQLLILRINYFKGIFFFFLAKIKC